ncbi:MAG TPA: acyloxyacyl hydrolase [Candidatus Acidoferrum sp.]|nr:acyloxyacyl hydrolase [Candidatus Acidoferrum sp.]
MVFGKQGLFTLCLLAATGFAGRAQDFSLESAGVRGGASFTSATRNFHQAEAFVNCNLPWDWNVDSRWRLKSRLDLSAGWLADPGGDAAVVTLGPTLALARNHFPLSFEGGVSPTLLSRSDFGTKDFGLLFQFTSHVGLNAELGRRVRIGYRFQHMSNSGLGNPNPGLNLHFLAVSYKF